MANLNLKFLRGLQSALPTAGTDGYFYLTTDTHRLYTSIDGKVVPVNEGVTTVADLNALTSVTGANAGDFFYCTQENILCVFNGQTFVQINPDTGVTSVEVVGEGNAVTDASYDPATRKLTLTKGETFATKAYVGDIPNDENGDPIAESVIAYINKKTDGIATSGNLEALGARVTTAEGEIDALQEASAKHVEKEEGKSLIADTEIERLAGMSDGANKVEASETNGNIKVDGEEVVVYTHPDKHTIAEVDGLGDALAGKQDVIPENTYDAYGSAAQALTDAKAYVDSEDVFHTDITTVNALGGIAAGADLDGMTTHEILNTLLFPYVAFVLGSTSRTAAAATLENGATQTLNSASISITKKSKPITSVKLLNGSTVLGEKTGDDVAAGGTITFSNLGITVSKSNNPNLKFTVTDGTTSTDKNVGASTFVYPYYMGECAADATIDETLIEGLTKKVESKGNKTVTHSCENGRMIIAYPKAHGVLKSILDPNNFETIGDYTRSEVSVTGLDGTTQTYYVYASGAATVSGFKVQYKY
jgi:hypothetical protein